MEPATQIDLDPIGLLLECAPSVSAAVATASRYIAENGWLELAADFASLRQYIQGVLAFVEGLLDPSVLASLMAKVSLAVVWLQELAARNPGSLEEARSQLFNALRVVSACLKPSLLSPSGLGQFVRDSVGTEMAVYTLGEIALFVIPLLNLDKLRTVMSVVLEFSRLWLRSTMRSLSSALRRYRAALVPSRPAKVAAAGDDAAADPGMCVCCRQLPCVPYLSNCGHIFCQECFTSRGRVDPEFPCPRCKRKVQYFVPANAQSPDPQELGEIGTSTSEESGIGAVGRDAQLLPTGSHLASGTLDQHALADSRAS